MQKRHLQRLKFLRILKEIHETKGLCCLPNGDICVASEFVDQMKIFDSSGRFLSAFGSDGPVSSRLQYPQGVCYLDRWSAPSSSGSSLFLIIDRQIISIWDVDHLQPISNIDLVCSPHNICVDLNGFIYVCNYYRIDILDHEKITVRFKLFICNGGWFDNLCVDDRNRLMVIDNTKKKILIFD